MTDPVDIATVLPKELRLGVPPKMPQARSYLFRQQSTLTSYQPGTTIQINIPRLQRSYLRKDSYLRFRLQGDFQQVRYTDGLVLDTAGAFGFFEKLEIFDYLGSTLLESISGVPQLTALLLDLGLKEIVETRNGNASMGLGLEYSYSGDIPFLPGTTAVVKTSTINNTGFVLPASSGARLTPYDNVLPPTTNPVAPADPTPIQYKFCREFAIPLPSFLGLLSEKMIPLHNGFTIVLTVAGKSTPMFVSQPQDLQITADSVELQASLAGLRRAPHTASIPIGNINWSLDDVYMNCQILELGPVAESMILSSSQGSPLVVHTKSMRNYVANLNPNTPEFTLNMNLNVASLTNILWIMRASDQIDSYQYASYGNRTRNFLQRWQFQYGSTALPQNNGIQAMGSSVPTALANESVTETYDFLSCNGKESIEELLKCRPLSLTSNRIIKANYISDAKFNARLHNSILKLDRRGLFPCENSYYNLGRFAAGLNLQLANGKDGQIICGLNTNGMNTSIRGVFHHLYISNMDQVRVDAWAEYDAFINISPGIATTVSF